MIDMAWEISNSFERWRLEKGIGETRTIYASKKPNVFHQLLFGFEHDIQLIVLSWKIKLLGRERISEKGKMLAVVLIIPYKLQTMTIHPPQHFDCLMTNFSPYLYYFWSRRVKQIFSFLFFHVIICMALFF